MKLFRRLFVLLLILSACFLSPATLLAQNTQNFRIDSFEADYYIGRTANSVSTMRVEEQITAVFPNFDQNHGILRAIPKEYKNHNLHVDVDKVTDERGVSYPYTTYSENDNLVLKIGSANSYVHGKTVYKISYNLREVISFEDSHDELYWDVNGDQWPQAFGSVAARVHIPDELDGQLQDRQLCFAGAFGEQKSDCTIERDEGSKETIVTVRANNLTGYETLTFVLAFSQNTFAPDRIAAMIRVLIILGIIALIIVPPLVTLLIAIRLWRAHGRDQKRKGTIIPEYVPPKHAGVLLSDMVLKEHLRHPAITATIIELAIKKYLVLHEIEEKKLLSKKYDYEIELIRPPHDLSAEQKQVVDSIFGKDSPVGKRVKISSLKNKLHTHLKKIETASADMSYNRGYFVVNPLTAKKRFMTPATLLIVLGVVCMFTGLLLPIGVPLLLSGIILFIATRAMPARTVAGVELRDYLLGMEMYMKLAEADRIKYLQSPEGVRQFGDIKDNKTKIKLFEKLLPYAMLFGIEKQWAEAFEDIYKEPPSWYTGHSGHFRTAYLASSLGNLSAATTASFSSPSSSSSSGFSGGGSSGGGGGGGGGGGW